MDVSLLGPLSISRNGSALELSGPKRRALLILLALNVGTPVSRDRIVEALWPERPTGREESTLRVHVSHLRDVLEPGRDGSPQVIVTRGAAYMLAAEDISLDIARFFRLAHEGRALLGSDPATAVHLLNEALGLWRGRPLQDVEYEEFAQEDIRRLESARVEALEDRAEALVDLGEDAAAIEDLEALVRADPTPERPVRLLMRALYRTGRQADSLRVARRHARRLAERGLEPSPRVIHLEELVLQHDASLLPEGSLSPSDIKPGRSVRGYELREEAGSGSIGVVYRAFQPSVGREVAVKAIHHHLAQMPEFVRRFAEEARVVAGLEHPHIVPLHDFWRDPAGAFLVMRWMEGGSLDQRIDRPWETAELGRVFGQLSEALGYAHSAGVVHRDVKPANVLFDTGGNAYLCDFGLAVTGIDTGADRTVLAGTIEPPYASPEMIRGEGPTAASDMFALGVLLAEAASGHSFRGVDTRLEGGISEVVLVATSANPADRYPDMSSFRSALVDAIGATIVPAPRRLRRNPYKGLAPFDEGDRADFYGRDDIVETLIDKVGSRSLTAIIGASGSGKSSVVLAGLIPELRTGALPGSDEWAIVHMVPGTDPFDEFHIGLRSAAVGHQVVQTGDGTHELRLAFAAALDGPNSRALLVVDQFEEVFSSEVEEDTRQRFLDNLVDLAVDPSGRLRVVLTLRADFSDRPLSHPRFGDLLSKSSLLLAQMRPEQVEDVIRRPAARVGIQVEPGLVAEIVRDVASAPAYLPLLQYVLTELFERRAEDRLTVQAYRSLGGLQGVLERRAEATFTSLSAPAQRACRQLFLRMVHIGDHGEETRRRLPLTELHGLGRRPDVDEALEAFAAVRLITYDRDPVTRTPTVEVAHETVIRRWGRYRAWIDEARADLLAHRNLSAAAATWAESDEDPSYLLTGGPLATALQVAQGSRINLNELEDRFVSESRGADEAARELEADRRRQETALQQSARRRLAMGLATGALAVVIALVAAFAWIERQRANDLAAAQERQNLARELAAASVANLTSADPDLSLLLALAGADQSIEADEEALPEVVEALHRAVINPRPDLELQGAGTATGGRLIDFSDDAEALVVLADDRGAMIVDPRSGAEVGRIPPVEPTAFGVDFHTDGEHVLTIHPDGVRQWAWRSGEMEFQLGHHVLVSTAAYSRDGSLIAIGGEDGAISVWSANSREVVAELEGGHTGAIASVDFDPTGARLVSSGPVPPSDGTSNPGWNVLVWDVQSGTVAARAKSDTFLLPIWQTTWHPSADAVVTSGQQGEIILIDAGSGERLNSFGNGQTHSRSVAFNGSGSLMVAGGTDGFARIFGTWSGGESAVDLPTGGVPLRDAAFDPTDMTVATLGIDGTLRIWRGFLGSELPERVTISLYPYLIATPDGSRYVLSAPSLQLGVPPDWAPMMEVIDSANGDSLVTRPAFQGWEPRSPAIAPDGSLVAFSGPGGEVEVVEVDTGVTTVLPGSQTWAASLAFSHDGKLLAGGGSAGTVAVWDTATAELVTILEGHGDRVETSGAGADLTVGVDGVVFHPQSLQLASGGIDGRVRVWDLATGEGRDLHTFEYEVFSVAYSPDGGLLAAADSTGSIVTLDPNSGELVGTPERVSGRTTLVFSPDGRYLAGNGPGALALLWDMESGRIVRQFRGAIYPPQSVAFVNGGTELRVASGEGIIRGYVLNPLDLVEIARSHISRDLSESECELYLRQPCAMTASPST